MEELIGGGAILKEEFLILISSAWEGEEMKRALYEGGLYEKEFEGCRYRLVFFDSMQITNTV